MTVQYSVLTHTRDVTLVHKKGKMEAHVYKSTRKLRSIIITLKGEFTQITKYHILSGGKWYYFDDAHRKAETSDTTTTADETKTVCMATAHNAAVRKKVFIFWSGAERGWFRDTEKNNKQSDNGSSSSYQV